MNSKAYLLFDLDGTLSDPLEGIAKSINHALKAFGYETRSHGELSRFIGPPLDLTFRELSGREDKTHILALVECFRDYFGRQGYAENLLYQGIPEIVKTLYRQGIPMAVCTAKREDFAGKIIRLFALEPYFDFISGGDTGVRKGDQIRALLNQGRISPQSIMIGDREGDISAARQNHIRSAGVLWGYGSRDELSTASPDWILGAPEDLAELPLHLKEDS